MSQIGYMTLGAGLGPAGYVFAIALLLAHGFFKAGLFLGAGSVMHGMNDEVNMRRYGGLARVMPITSVTFGLGVPGHHRHPAVLRVLHQGPHHRGGLHRARRGRQGTRHLRADRRGHHRVLHDPDDVHDLVREAALGARGASARVAAGDDLADDRARDRLGGCRRVPYPQRPAAELPGPGGRGPAHLGRRRSARRAWWPWCSPWSAWPWPGSCTGGCRCPRSLRAGGLLTVAARKDLYGDATVRRLPEELPTAPGPART